MTTHESSHQMREEAGPGHSGPKQGDDAPKLILPMIYDAGHRYPPGPFSFKFRRMAISQKAGK